MHCCFSSSVVLDVAMGRSLLIHAVSFLFLISAVSCQACTTPGSLNHSNISYNRNTTYILNGYTVQCEGIVTTWEFCYHMNSSVPSATFYPGIWNKTGKVFYTHIQSNTVTFTPNGTNINSCENYTIPEAERFTVPSGSVVGLYSNFNVQLLRTNDTNQQMPTYQFDGNQSDVTINGNTKKAGYNVAIRVHVAIALPTTSSTISPPLTSNASTPVMATTSTPVMATTLTPVMSNTTTPVMATTSTPVMATTSTPVMATTSTPVMATTSTPVMATTSTPVMATTSTPVMATTSTPVMATTSTPVMATTSTPVMATTSTPVMATTLSSIVSANLASYMSTTLSSIVSSTLSLNMSITSTSITSTTSTSNMSTPLSSFASTTLSSNKSVTLLSTNVTSVVPTNLSSIAVMSSTLTPTSLTSVMYNSLTPVISSSTAANMSTTIALAMSSSIIPTNGTVGGNDKGSTMANAIGIIAGTVAGVVLCTLLLLLFFWCIRHKRERFNVWQAKYETDSHGSCAIDGTFVYKNPTYDYETPETWRDDVFTSFEPIPYIAPDDAIESEYPKIAYSDYETCQKTDDYSTALHVYSTNVNDLQASPVIYDDVPDDIKPPTYTDVINEGSDSEAFSDPGHSEEAIYACFERKMFQTIKSDDIKIVLTLGSGEFGVVHLGTWVDGSTDPKQVAVKILNTQCTASDKVKFLREAAIMGQFKDNHIVELYGVVTEKENTMIVLEYMPKGDLHEFLSELKNATPPEAYDELRHDLLSFCRHIAAGLCYLAGKKFVHRDLAARNILVSSDDVCKIADFGMARDVSDDTYYMSSGGKIPLKWTAPEAIFYKKYTTQSDVWSFGCVMYEIWSLGHKPFEDCDGKEYLTKITNGYRLSPPPGCPRAMYQLMIQCWNPVASQRVHPSEISRALQKSDRTLLPSRATLKDSEEMFTTLGASLDTSSHIFTDLQNTYLPK
ncbi:uncharacterized protein [Dysidea avara]|uniref:uncharacterized protein isoform X3 n=1 Tax=Dysidea avara TaxID=196820 RepID=UPI003320EE34